MTDKEAKKLRIIGKYFVEAIKQNIMNFNFDEFMDDLPSDCLLELESIDNEDIDIIHEFDELNLKYNGLFCEICREPQYLTPSGNMCKNGHGGAYGVMAGEITPQQITSFIHNK